MLWLFALVLGLSTPTAPSIGAGSALYYPDTAATTPAYIMATNGSDSNPCTLTQPCATWAHMDSLMTSTSIHTTYLRAGTYNISNRPVHSNEYWANFPGDPRDSPVINNLSGTAIGCFSGCTNITFYGFTENGGTPGTALLGFNYSTHIQIWDSILDATITQALVAYNNDYIYFQGNTVNGAVNSGWDSISLPRNDNADHTYTVVTDNIFNICGRFCIEAQSPPGNGGISSYTYFDRDNLSGFEGTHNTCAAGSPTFGGMSLVYGPGNNSSVQGNILSIPANANTCSIGMESEMGGATVANNSLFYTPIAIQCCGASGGQYAGLNQYFLNNTIYIPTTNTSAGALGGVVSFGKDGGFSLPAQFTIGTNTIVDSSSHSVIGCQNSAGTSPGWCGLGTNTFPSPPSITPPSPVWNQ